MQDPTFFPAMKSQQQQQIPQFPEQEQHLKCPRCDSTNTKFCYYNNYNLSQPRHFCKACRRYWTKGGSLRNIPVGGGTRKNSKRSSTSDTSNPNTNPPKRFAPSSNSMIPTSVLGYSQLQMPKVDSLGPTVYSISGEEQIGRLGSMGLGLVGGVSDGSFSSLLATNEHYRSLLGSFHHDNNSHGVVVTIPNSAIANSNNSGLGSPVAASIPPPSPPQNLNFWNNGGSNGGSSGDSNGGSGRWSDLSIYTPGSSIP